MDSLRRRGASVVLTGMIACACAGGPVAREPLVSVIEVASPAVVAIGNHDTVFGSGFRVRDTRLIATAAHVLKALSGPPEVRWHGLKLAARVVAVDDLADVGVIALEAEPPMPGLVLRSEDAPLPPGTTIVVIGCPFGAEATATTGIVSARPGAVLEPVSLRGRIQLNAAVNPGNSGGPVLDLRGEVIGIANATIPGGFGLGFSIPASSVRSLIAGAAGKP